MATGGVQVVLSNGNLALWLLVVAVVAGLVGGVQFFTGWYKSTGSFVDVSRIAAAWILSCSLTADISIFSSTQFLTQPVDPRRHRNSAMNQIAVRVDTPVTWGFHDTPSVQDSISDGTSWPLQY